MDTPIRQLDGKQLRHFALTTGALFVLIFGLFLPWLFVFPLPLWPWLLAGVLTLAGLAIPDKLQPVYSAWMRLALLLNRITSPIIMGTVFYLVIFPTGLIARLVGYDPMARKHDPTLKSYRVPSQKAPKHNMEKPF